MSLSKPARKDALTQFLMFKVAIRSKESDIAADCLQDIANANATTYELLYACVLEAKDAGDRFVAITAMQIISQRCDYTESDALNVPCLIRCTIRMIEELLKDRNFTKDGVEVASFTDKVCELFERGTVPRNFYV